MKPDYSFPSFLLESLNTIAREGAMRVLTREANDHETMRHAELALGNLEYAADHAYLAAKARFARNAIVIGRSI